MPITRQHRFVTDTPIFANDLNDEWGQIYSFLSGGISNNIILRNIYNVCLILQNTSSGQVILELANKNGIMFQILQNQQFKSLVVNDAPIDVISTTKVVGLNAQYLDGLSLSNFPLINTKHTENYINFYFQNAANQVVNAGDKCAAYFVPEATNMNILSAQFKCKQESSSDNCSVSLRKNGAIITTAQLGINTNFEVNVNMNSPISEGDVLTVTLDSIVGLIENLWCRLKVNQNLVA